MMNKHKILLSLLCILFLPACKNRQQTHEELDKEYSKAFDKEYAEFLQSERLKTFYKNFETVNKLVALTELNDSMPVLDSTAPVGTLCFVPEREAAAAWERSEKEDIALNDGEVKPILFKDYQDYSADVNAIIVDADFAGRYQQRHLFPIGYELQDIARLGKERKTFDDDYGYSGGEQYQQFCRLQQAMKRLEHCKYLLVIKVAVGQQGELLSSSLASGSFNMGFRYAFISVFDMRTGTLLRRLPVVATNSEQVQVEQNSENASEKINEDLDRNFTQEVRKVIEKNFKIKGELNL